jgi:hypothetical protein
MQWIDRAGAEPWPFSMLGQRRCRDLLRRPMPKSPPTTEQGAYAPPRHSPDLSRSPADEDRIQIALNRHGLCHWFICAWETCNFIRLFVDQIELCCCSIFHQDANIEYISSIRLHQSIYSSLALKSKCSISHAPLVCSF